MYEPYTEYDGFSTLGVWNNEDGSQYVRLEDGPLIWISGDGKESVLIRD